MLGGLVSNLFVSSSSNPVCPIYSDHLLFNLYSTLSLALDTPTDFPNLCFDSFSCSWAVLFGVPFVFSPVGSDSDSDLFIP